MHAKFFHAWLLLFLLTLLQLALRARGAHARPSLFSCTISGFENLRLSFSDLRKPRARASERSPAPLFFHAWYLGLRIWGLGFRISENCGRAPRASVAMERLLFFHALYLGFRILRLSFLHLWKSLVFDLRKSQASALLRAVGSICNYGGLCIFG